MEAESNEQIMEWAREYVAKNKKSNIIITTVLLIALAACAVAAINYTRDDFGLHHPAGALGKKLLVKVKNLMYSGDNDAVVLEGSTLRRLQ